MTDEQRDATLNVFALRSFRDTADGDYVTARLAYRADLIPQAFWSSLQAVEKYLKCLLLLRRIPWTKGSHSLTLPLAELEKDFAALSISGETREFKRFLDTNGSDRYFTYSCHSEGLELMKLDHAVWDLGRYCISYRLPKNQSKSPNGRFKPKTHLASRNYVSTTLSIASPGPLDKLLQVNRKSPAQIGLQWNNLYFGRSVRNSIKTGIRRQAVNSTLALHPKIVADLDQLMFLPKEVRTEAGLPPRRRN